MTRISKPLSCFLTGALLSGAALMAQGAASGTTQTKKAPAAKATVAQAPKAAAAPSKAPATTKQSGVAKTKVAKSAHRTRKGVKHTQQVKARS